MSAEPDVTLDEMRALLPTLPGPDLEAGTAATLRNRHLSKTPGSLGRLEDLPIWLATWQGKHPPEVRHPRIAIFAASHGIAARLRANPAEYTSEQRVANIVGGGAAINQFGEAVDADLRVYEMALEQPTVDFLAEPAMNETDCARAMAYGMMAVETGIDLLALGEIAVGNRLSAAALCLALFGGQGEDWLADAEEADLVTRAVAFHRPQATDKLDLFRRLGGIELAAAVGAVIAARRGRVPVVLDSFATTAAAAVLFAIDHRALDHCVVGQLTDGVAHGKLLAILGQKPLLDLGVRSGEAIGATLAIGVIKAAAAAHAGMATRDEARVAMTR